jgi:hypothetical protein
MPRDSAGLGLLPARRARPASHPQSPRPARRALRRHVPGKEPPLIKRNDDPVPLENRIRQLTCRSSGRQAARTYSLISPPRTGFRRICHVPTLVTGRGVSVAFVVGDALGDALVRPVSRGRSLSSACGGEAGHSAANHNRSAGSYRTRLAWRRSTAFSCRSTNSSAAFARSPRNTRTATPSTRHVSR